MASDEEQLVLSISADTRQILRAIKRLEGDIGKSASSIEKSFAGVGKGIDKSINTTVQKRINEITGVGVQATKEWTGALANQGKELERMRARFNPIFSVVKRYKTTVGEIQAAQRLGAISSDEMTAAMQRERQAALSSIAALKQRNAALVDTPMIAGRGVGTFNTANIAAQFQDIGVTAAMGQSAMTIALQQGTQLAAVLNTMGGTRNVISGLGAAFASIISPVSLVTIGVVGLTAVALKYFMTFLDGSDDTEKALKEQAALIQKVADKWGDALPSLKAYADEQKRLADETEKRQAVEQRTKDIWKPLKDETEEVRASVIDLATQIGNIPEYQHGLVEVQRAFEGLNDKVKDGKAETEDLDRVSKALTDLFQQSGIPIVADLADRFSILADQIKRAANESSKLNTDVAFQQNGSKIFNAVKKTTSILPRLDPLGQFDANRDQTNRANATKSQYQIEQERLARSARKGTRAPRRTADDRFFEDIEAIQQRTRALAEEKSMIGQTFEEQTKRRVAFDLETQALKQVREEARRKGDQDWQNAQLTPDQVKQIDEVSEAYARQADELRRAHEAQQFQRDALKGALSDFSQAWADGKIEAKEWGDIVLNVLDKVINKIEDDLVDAILNANKAGSSGGGGGNLFGWISKGVSWLFGGGASTDPWEGLRMAGGGRVSGPGGPTGDKIPAMLSDGEHVTRAAMAKKYAPVLDAINADRLPALAGGGFVASPITGPQMPAMPRAYNDNSPAVSIAYAPVYTINSEDGDPRKIVAAIDAYDKGRLARLKKDLPELRRRTGTA